MISVHVFCVARNPSHRVQITTTEIVSSKLGEIRNSQHEARENDEAEPRVKIGPKDPILHEWIRSYAPKPLTRLFNPGLNLSAR